MTRVGTVSLRLASYCVVLRTLYCREHSSARGEEADRRVVRIQVQYAFVRPIFPAEVRRLAASRILSSINGCERAAALCELRVLSYPTG